MKRTLNSLCQMAYIGVLVSAAVVHAQTSDQKDESSKPVNAMCPIGKEPIVSSAGTVEYKNHAIGLCCPSCGKAFLSWDEQRKDDFVALAIRGQEPGHEAHGAASQPAASQPVSKPSFPYTLDTCIVSGQKLGSMGEPIVKMYDGREVRFCCAGCIGRFEADQAGYWEKIDELIVQDQLRYYPVDRCVVSGESLVVDGEDISNNMVYQNRLVRLCCKMCERQFKADPARFIEKLDKAVVEAQREDYPLQACVVAGGALGSMGEPAEIVIAGRLMRFCCAGCEPAAKANPSQYLVIIDKAWQDKGRYMNQDNHDGG